MKKAEGPVEDKDWKIEEEVVKIEKERRQVVQQRMIQSSLHVTGLYTIGALYYCHILYV